MGVGSKNVPATIARGTSTERLRIGVNYNGFLMFIQKNQNLWLPSGNGYNMGFL